MNLYEKLEKDGAFSEQKVKEIMQYVIVLASTSPTHLS